MYGEKTGNFTVENSYIILLFLAIWLIIEGDHKKNVGWFYWSKVSKDKISIDHACCGVQSNKNLEEKKKLLAKRV